MNTMPTPHEFVSEHSAALGEHSARIGNLEKWVKGLDDGLEAVKETTLSTAQSIRALTKLSWILFGSLFTAAAAGFFTWVFK